MEISLQVDHEHIELNDFVRRILSGTITGAICSLDGVDEDFSSITIQIKK